MHITDVLNEHLKITKNKVVLNLASNEYYNAVKPKALDAAVIAFRFQRDEEWQIQNPFYVCQVCTRFNGALGDSKQGQPEELKKFKVDGYVYNKALSIEAVPVFTRG